MGTGTELILLSRTHWFIYTHTHTCNVTSTSHFRVCGIHLSKKLCSLNQYVFALFCRSIHLWWGNWNKSWPYSLVQGYFVSWGYLLHHLLTTVLTAFKKIDVRYSHLDCKLKVQESLQWCQPIRVQVCKTRGNFETGKHCCVSDSHLRQWPNSHYCRDSVKTILHSSTKNKLRNMIKNIEIQREQYHEGNLHHRLFQFER